MMTVLHDINWSHETNKDDSISKVAEFKPQCTNNANVSTNFISSRLYADGQLFYMSNSWPNAVLPIALSSFGNW